jgi:hypothetical protein
LYILDITDGSYERLTDDIYYDTDPSFSYDGKSILFSSDRCAGGEEGAINIYRYDLDSKNITQLTFGTYRDLTPLSTEHGVYFSSNRESRSFNIFLLDNNGVLTRQSTYATGAMDPRLSPEGTRLTYTGYQSMSFQIYQMELPEQPKEIVQPRTFASADWKPVTIESRSRSTTIKYDTDYSFDIAQSSIGYDPVYGSIGGIQAAVSDVLGNRAIHFLLTNTAQSKDDFLESFNFGLTYINRERQLNWGIGAFHLYNEYYNDYDEYYFERQAGGIALLSYPMSKFTRLDFTTLAAYSKRELEFLRGSREAFLVSNFLSYVYDNSLWDISGPIEGRRYNFTVGISNDLRTKRNFASVAMADIRHYFRLGKYSAFANRLFGYTSSGVEPRRIYFGGSWSFRGFSRRHWYTRNVLFASTELRFPLIDRLTIGFPFGGLGFSSIRGALFFDTGSAWEDEFDQFLGSFGAGFRVALSYFIVFRFDFSRTTDFKTISPRTDFDFFFGWNF